jgi:hypothetical protein
MRLSLSCCAVTWSQHAITSSWSTDLIHVHCQLPSQVAVMNVLVPLLVEVARPPAGTPVTPLLRDMACKLVSAMPTSAAAAAFRTAVTALPAASKQRLQLALKEQQAAAAAAPAAGSGVAAAAAGAAPLAAAADARKPAIQLKMNFSMPGAAK